MMTPGCAVPVAWKVCRSLVLGGLLLVALACVAAPSSARADGLAELRYITEIYPPFNYVDDGGHPAGLYIDLLELMWAELGVPPQPIEVMPWVRGMYFLRNRADVVLFGAAWTPERAEAFQYVYPVLQTVYVLIALKDARVRVGSLEDVVKGHHVGVVQEDVCETLALEHGLPDAILERASSMDALMDMMLRGRFDLLLIDKGSIDHIARRHGLAPGDIEIVHVLEHTSEGFMLSAGVPGDLVARMQAALEAVQARPEFAALLRRYGQ